MTLSARLVTAASFVIEIDDVFDDRITSGRHSLSKIAEQFRLDLEALAGRLDDEVARRQPHPIHSRGDPRNRRIARLGSDFLFRDLALQVLADGLHAPIKEALIDIHQHHVVARLREHMGNAIAHGARANDSHIFDFHNVPRMSA